MEGQRPGICSDEGGARRSIGAGQVDEALADVDADDLHPPTGEGVGVATRAAPDVEDPHPGFEAQHVDEEAALLVGALGARVAQVGSPPVVGPRLEPTRVLYGKSVSVRLDLGGR